MNTSLQALSDAGVAIWLDDLSRQRLATGNLAALIADYNVTGVTTNPTIFAAALASRDRYIPQLSGLAAVGVDADQAIRTLTTDDVRAACDVLAEVYTATAGRDGRVSIEVDPRLAFDTEATVTNALDLCATSGLHNDRPRALLPRRHHRTCTRPDRRGPARLSRLSCPQRLPGVGDADRRRLRHLGRPRRRRTTSPPAQAATHQPERDSLDPPGGRQGPQPPRPGCRHQPRPRQPSPGHIDRFRPRPTSRRIDWFRRREGASLRLM